MNQYTSATASGTRIRTIFPSWLGAQPVRATEGPPLPLLPPGVEVPLDGVELGGGELPELPVLPAAVAVPLAEAFAMVIQTPAGRTRASPRARRSQSTRPSASCFTESTRCCLTWLKFPYAASEPARACA